MAIKKGTAMTKEPALAAMFNKKYKRPESYWRDYAGYNAFDMTLVVVVAVGVFDMTLVVVVVVVVCVCVMWWWWRLCVCDELFLVQGLRHHLTHITRSLPPAPSLRCRGAWSAPRCKSAPQIDAACCSVLAYFRRVVCPNRGFVASKLGLRYV